MTSCAAATFVLPEARFGHTRRAGAGCRPPALHSTAASCFCVEDSLPFLSPSDGEDCCPAAATDSSPDALGHQNLAHFRCSGAREDSGMGSPGDHSMRLSGFVKVVPLRLGPPQILIIVKSICHLVRVVVPLRMSLHLLPFLRRRIVRRRVISCHTHYWKTPHRQVRVVVPLPLFLPLLPATTSKQERVVVPLLLPPLFLWLPRIRMCLEKR